MDYYNLLGVPYDALSDAISKAFKKMAVKYHPDKTKDPADHSRFLQVNEAYETLKSTESRQKYDMKIAGKIRASRASSQASDSRGSYGTEARYGMSGMRLAGTGRDTREFAGDSARPTASSAGYGAGYSASYSATARAGMSGARPPKLLPEHKAAMDEVAREYMERIRREAELRRALEKKAQQDVEREHRAKEREKARERELLRQQRDQKQAEKNQPGAHHGSGLDFDHFTSNLYQQRQNQYRGQWAEKRRYDNDIFSANFGLRQGGESGPAVTEENLEPKTEPSPEKPQPEVPDIPDEIDEPPAQSAYENVDSGSEDLEQEPIPVPEPEIIELSPEPEPEPEVIHDTTPLEPPKKQAQTSLARAFSLHELEESLGPDPDNLSPLRDSLPEVDSAAAGPGGSPGTKPRKVLRPRSRIAEFIDGTSKASTLHTPVNTYRDPRTARAAVLTMEDFHALAAVLEVMPPVLGPEVTQSAPAFAQYQADFEAYREKIIQYQVERAVQDRELRAIYSEDYREFAVYVRCLERDRQVMGRYMEAVAAYEGVMRLV